MKVIILAAGQGTRLRPYTDDRPKCMVELKCKPLLHHQLEVIEEYGVNRGDIALVAGYLQEALVAPGVKQYRNDHYATTNMVATLFAAQDFMQVGEDLIISYGDIVYKPEVLEKLLATDGELVVVADIDWYDLWTLRMDNPLDDAETFKMTEDGKVLELGKKPSQREDAQAQYIGLIKVSGRKVADFIQHYQTMDKTAEYDGKDFDNMYMTSLIQNIIDSGWDTRAALINRGWLEVDSVEDLEAYESLENIL
ncbi:NTP transferase domain-containing protein [Psychrobacter celer]|uniref:phosphocholine cytidylyltransferase family protein n=1 Tax=Psychrobacter celer TaxID=306572 RepID=UPI003FD174A5